MFHSILDLLLKISFWANFYSSYYIILSYLVKNSIQRNMNRRGEKRVGAWREKSLSFTKTEKEKWISNIGEQIIVIYIWKIDEKGHVYLENQASSTLNLRRWFRLCAISHLYWCSNSKVFVDVWLSPEKSIGEFSINKWVLWYGLRSEITISACNYFKVCLEYSGYASHFLFQARLVTCKSAKKWYLIRMCISCLCPFNSLLLETHKILSWK